MKKSFKTDFFLLLSSWNVVDFDVDACKSLWLEDSSILRGVLLLFDGDSSFFSTFTFIKHLEHLRRKHQLEKNLDSFIKQLTSNEILTSYRLMMCCKRGGNSYGIHYKILSMALSQMFCIRHIPRSWCKTTCCHSRRSSRDWSEALICWRMMNEEMFSDIHYMPTRFQRGFEDSLTPFRDICHTQQSVDLFQPK